MKNSHLKNWLSLFPDLKFILNQSDKEVLNTIDPAEYINHNLTSASEVLRIIEDHKPQAWKWERLYPNLKNLSAEDHEILEHIVPSDFLLGITEADVRRIIEYRKGEANRIKENEEFLRAKNYYEKNKDEIKKEERFRSKLTKVFRYSLLGGITLVSAGIFSHTPFFTVTGTSVLLGATAIVSLVLRKVDRNTVIPKPKKHTDEKIDFMTAAFVVFYFIGLIGFGIALSSLFVWSKLGWDKAEPVLYFGLITTGLSLILFLITAIVTPQSKE